MVKSILKITDIQRILQQSDEQVERPSEKRQGIHLKPSIWAMPGAVISQGTSVTILCRGPPGITRYRLEQAGSSQVWYEENPQDFQKEATSSSHWSQAAMQDLILVNMRILSSYISVPMALPVPISSPTSSAFESAGGDKKFLLSQEGSAYSTQLLKSQYKAGRFQGNFTMGFRWRAHRGGVGSTYRCCGSLSTFPSLWLDPRDSLKLTGRREEPKVCPLFSIRS
ncbi:leukocyte immunoglobulin-like receptor subfamily B member 4 [Loxodonta africana]|uniref:leukocyte immunoglobulin-like receptor subfamily B member 4 n=1 Tax=Loxodonta africana TaxID=9785 RepID=UPI0030CC99D8